MKITGFSKFLFWSYKNICISPIDIIASLKLAAIAQRNTIRDYYDLYFLSKFHLPLAKIFEQTRKLIPRLIANHIH